MQAACSWKRCARFAWRLGGPMILAVGEPDGKYKAVRLITSLSRLIKMFSTG